MMNVIEHGEVFAWGLIVAGLVFALLHGERPGRMGGALAAAALAALVTKSALLGMG